MTLIKILLLLSLALLALLLLQRLFFSFAAQSPHDYADTTPEFDLRRHLDGPLVSEGVIYGPAGRIASRFTARMHGAWSNQTGTLREEFTYANGETLAREWTITPGPQGRFTATAPDVVGQATGQASGATIRMRYRLKLEKSAGGHVLDVTDWLYLTAEGAIMNRSQMRKFGIKVAELVATIRPAAADRSDSGRIAAQ